MSKISDIIEKTSNLADKAAELSERAVSLTEDVINLKQTPAPIEIPAPIVHQTTEMTVVNGVDPFIFAITVFILACFVGYYVVWKVTPALHTPLMSVTNAVSSIIVVGAILAVGSAAIDAAGTLGAVAIFIASINIFGGFIVTHRMLRMFKKKG